MSLRERAILTAADEYATALIRLKPWLGNPESPQYAKLFEDVMQKRDRLVQLAARRALSYEGVTAHTHESGIQKLAASGMRDGDGRGQSSAGE